MIRGTVPDRGFAADLWSLVTSGDDFEIPLEVGCDVP